MLYGGTLVKHKYNNSLRFPKISFPSLVKGKHVTVPGFRRKEFRGKLAIAITANFKNMRTTAEATVEEISGVAFVYKQDFFNNLYDEFGIALENIVYYKVISDFFIFFIVVPSSILDFYFNRNF